MPTYTLRLALAQVDLVATEDDLPAGVDGFAADDGRQIEDVPSFGLDSTLHRAQREANKQGGRSGQEGALYS